jgi:hypothetical protein
VIFFLNPSVFAATVVVSLTGLATDSLGNYALANTSIGYSVAGSVSSQKWQSSTNGSVLAGDIGGATSTTFTPIIGSNVTNYHYIRVAVIIGGTEYYSTWTQVANIPMVSGADLDLSFTVGVAVSNVNLLQNWTLNGNTVSSYSITGAALPAGISASSTSTEVRLSGAPSGVTADSTRTLTVFDGRGRPVVDTFTLETINTVSVLVPPTTYALTLPAPTVTGLSLTVTADSRLLGVGPTADISIDITSPASYSGIFTVDQSVEGAAANLNLGSILTAPQCLVNPVITRTTGSSDVIGSTYTVTPDLWLYDGDDVGTINQAGQWRLGGSPISGATGVTYVSTAAGALTYLGTITGAGTTRTALSNSITVGGSPTLNVPLTTYILTQPIPQITLGAWSITAGNASATINGFPSVPTTPAWSITAGNASATIVDFPGEV